MLNDYCREPFWRAVYEILYFLIPFDEYTMSNFGFAYLNGTGILLDDLREDFEVYKYQLYHYVVILSGGIKTLSEKNILEIGSGRGGGLNFIRDQLRPKSATGVDFSLQAVTFANEHFCTQRQPNLKFVQGNACALEAVCGAAQYDVAISIESGNCYSDVQRFVDGVARALNKNGILLYADYVHSAEDLAKLET